MIYIKAITLLFTLTSFAVFSQQTELAYSLGPASTNKMLSVELDSIFVTGDLGSFSVKKTLAIRPGGVQVITFDFKSDSLAELPPVTIGFNFPSIAINGYWNPKISIDKVNYYHSDISSKASRNAPVLSFYDNELQNRITFALSDALNQSNIVCYLKEEDVKFYPEIELFKEKMPKVKSYSIELRIDTRPVPYYKAISDVAKWWANRPEYKPMSVPDGARRPMYSTWYSYHQQITTKEIVAECKIAKSLGCGAVIVDDGWQTQDGNRGYAYTGDWTPERIGDMKKFVDLVHKEDMQFILWYSLPFMGEKAKNHSNFEGKFLRYWESQGTYVLDPRYPEVRAYIVNTYIKAVNDWDLDGFKLDFIGWFTATSETELTKADGRDYASVNNATDALMTEITTKLTAIKPNILIEFRQPYIGPLMRKYGNMFRGVDAPNNAVANRVETTNLRILSGETAVHSDMFIWRNEETPETAALQILNILYSVPQLSVKLNEIPEKHLKMITYWFSYWNENRNVLLDGLFIPSNPGANYPILTAVKNDVQITTVYENYVVSPETTNLKRFDIINAKLSNKLTFELRSEWKGTLKIFNYEGKLYHKKKILLSPGIHQYLVPDAGTLRLERTK